MIKDSLDKLKEKNTPNSAFDGFAQEAPTSSDLWDYGPVLGQAGDIATTALALSKNTLEETNPITKKSISLVGLPITLLFKAGLGVGAGLIVHSLREQGNHRTAKIISGIATLAGLGPAINNLNQLHK